VWQHQVVAETVTHSTTLICEPPAGNQLYFYSRSMSHSALSVSVCSAVAVPGGCKWGGTMKEPLSANGHNG